jgi:hypothetical protein
VRQRRAVHRADQQRCGQTHEALEDASVREVGNGTAESWVGTCRREILDRVIARNERHLHRRLREYVGYTNAERVHTHLRDAPHRRPLETRPSLSARLVGLPRAGGLHHRYVWHEAV